MISRRLISFVLISIALVESMKFNSYWEKYLVQKHNSYRSTRLHAKAANMQKLKWSVDIASSAEKWALHLKYNNGCRMKHPSGNYRYGQNLAESFRGRWSSNLNRAHQDMLRAAMNGWGIKEQRYTVKNVLRRGLDRQVPYAKNLGFFNHYTQLVWADTRLIGCAWVDCGAYRRGYRLTVCEYDPPGNVRHNGRTDAWYLRGKPCSKCSVGQKCDVTGHLCEDR